MENILLINEMNYYLKRIVFLFSIFLIAVSLKGQVFVEQTSVVFPDLEYGIAEWGDYDNDGDLDVVIIGNENYYTHKSKVYKNNGNNTFTWVTSIVLPDISEADVAWGDYDNDGDLDLVLSGYIGYGITRIYKNMGNDSFVEQTDILLQGVFRGSVDWGDYDNDGDLDLLYSGMSNFFNQGITKVYRNYGNNLFIDQYGLSLDGVYNSNSEWGDYDNDGDLDIICSGNTEWYHGITRIYKNNGNNSFTNISGLTFSSLHGKVTWGDYDGDKDLDILTSVYDSLGPIYVNIYKNMGNDVFAIQPGISFGSTYGAELDWIDFDNDGKLDIFISTDNSTELYKNNGNNFFSIQNTSLSNGLSFAWGDYDNDGDLDVLQMGKPFVGTAICKLFKNDSAISNSKPSVPTGLSSQFIGNKIQLSWNSSFDSTTISGGITYNIWVGSSNNITDIKSPQANTTTGFRRVASEASLQDTIAFIRIPLSVTEGSSFYWAVQAVDASWYASPFSNTIAQTNTFSIGGMRADTIAPGDTSHLHINHNAISNVTYSWSPSNTLSNSTVQSPEAMPTHTTTYTVSVTEGAVTLVDSVIVYIEEFSEQKDILIPPFKKGDVEWGDYDNDGNLDFIIGGISNNNSSLSVYRNNGNNSFTGHSIIINGVKRNGLEWGDYNNDGYLDVLAYSYSNLSIYKNNAYNVFTKVSSNMFANLNNASSAWGDYDNDGDLDIITSGYDQLYYNEVTKIYKNNGNNTFTSQLGLSLLHSQNGEVKWVDVNNDGLLDILILANDSSFLYKNNGNNNFSKIQNFGSNYISNSDFADYDGDGDLDFVLMHDDGKFKVYKNNGSGVFSLVIIPQSIRIDIGAAKWGDYDNDGDLDLLVTGRKPSFNNIPIDDLAFIYENMGNDIFERRDDIHLIGAKYSSADWGDYDNDGDLDIIICGNTGSRIYRNNLIINSVQQSNNPPSVPTGLSLHILNDSVLFTWNASTDVETPSQCLTYNLRVGSTISSIDLRSPQSILNTGKHLIANMGSIQDTFYKMKIQDSSIFWSVQAIDNGFLPSAFSLSDSNFVLTAMFSVSQDTFNLPPFNASFINNSIGSFNKWVWSFGDGLVSVSKTPPQHLYQHNGDYTIKLIAIDTISNFSDTASHVIHCYGGVNNPCTLISKLTQNQSLASICRGDSFRLSAISYPNISYSWFKNGVLIPNENDSIYYAKVDGVYSALLSDSNCSKATDNYFMLNIFPDIIPPLITDSGSIASCSNDSILLEASSGFVNYLWSNGAIGRKQYVTQTGNYYVEVSDSNNCVTTSQSIFINATSIQAPTICSATVDENFINNRIEWLPDNNQIIDSFIIYRNDNNSSLFQRIGSVSHLSNPYFVDSSVNVSSLNYLYKISSLDTCGMETPYSDVHKTMLLKVFSDSIYWRLDWDAYYGFTNPSYFIYKGSDSLNMQLFATVNNNEFSFIDIYWNNSDDAFYQVQVSNTGNCNGNVAHSFSNIVNTATIVNVDKPLTNNNDFKLFPNPNTGSFTLSIDNTSRSRKRYSIEIYDLRAKLIHKEFIYGTGHIEKRLNINNISNGVYFIYLKSDTGYSVKRFIKQ